MLDKTIKSYLSFSKRALDILGWLAACMLFTLVVLLSYNVIARYLFQSSSIAIEELSWHLYAAIFLLGIPYALKTQSHVRVDLFYDRWSAKTQAWVDLIACLLFLIPTCFIIIWAGWEFTKAAYSFGPRPDSIDHWFSQLASTGIGERSQDAGGLLNRWIIKGVIPFSFVFLLFASINFLVEKVQILRGKITAKTEPQTSHLS